MVVRSVWAQASHLPCHNASCFNSSAFQKGRERKFRNLNENESRSSLANTKWTELCIFVSGVLRRPLPPMLQVKIESLVAKHSTLKRRTSANTISKHYRIHVVVHPLQYLLQHVLEVLCVDPFKGRGGGSEFFSGAHPAVRAKRGCDPPSGSKRLTSAGRMWDRMLDLHALGQRLRTTASMWHEWGGGAQGWTLEDSSLHPHVSREILYS